MKGPRAVDLKSMSTTVGSVTYLKLLNQAGRSNIALFFELC
jgi:hypothetical protein